MSQEFDEGEDLNDFDDLDDAAKTPEQLIEEAIEDILEEEGDSALCAVCGKQLTTDEMGMYVAGLRDWLIKNPHPPFALLERDMLGFYRNPDGNPNLEAFIDAVINHVCFACRIAEVNRARTLSKKLTRRPGCLLMIACAATTALMVVGVRALF
jgi:hypothetical protein